MVTELHSRLLSENIYPLITELELAPDPWLICRQLAHLPNLLFLDSVHGPRELSRYSFVTADPFRWVIGRGNRLGIHDRINRTSKIIRVNPFSLLGDQASQFSLETIAGLPPFQGGMAGLFGYELNRQLERLPATQYNDFEVPDLAVGFFDWVVAFDHQQNRSWIISTGLPEQIPNRRITRAQSRLDQIYQRLQEDLPAYPKQISQPPLAIDSYRKQPVPKLANLFSNFNPRQYQETIGKAVEYIHAGDCFQVNIAQRLLHPSRVSALELYGQLRKSNPAPFAGYFDLGKYQIASASPERFLQMQNGVIETRPIKGTRPRGNSPEEEQRNGQELLESAKDRAENVMIVDLLRNDIGRVCEYGSIDVTDVCKLETYQYVHHLVSVIKGRIREELGPIDLLRATFPGGSVTGAPKIRAMEIITELEQVARGPYCGSLGYLGFDGSIDTNILIRTFSVGGGWVQFSVGGGIVADSDPEKEYAETWHKAKGMMEALI